jgi:ankyrin repeat protein
MILDSSLSSVDAKERIATPPSHNENRKALVPQLELPKDVGTTKLSNQGSPNWQCQKSSDYIMHFDETETASFAVSSTRVLRRIPSQQEKMLYSHYCIPAGKLESIHLGNEWRLAGYNPWCSQDLFPKVEFETCFLEQGATACEMEALETKIAKEFAEVIKLVKQGKYDEVEEKLCSHDWVVPVDYENAEGNSIFMICCQYGSKRIAKLLLKKGSSINKQNMNGHTCLHYAFGYGFGE